MPRLWLAVPRYIEEPEPALVQHEHLWGKGQDEALPQKEERERVATAYFIGLSGLAVVKKNPIIAFSIRVFSITKKPYTQG